MITLLATAYLASSYTYAYMLVEEQEGKTRWETMKENHGENWWKYYVTASPMVLGRAIKAEAVKVDYQAKAKDLFVKAKNFTKKGN